jgi:curli biogenesis system outer membrane secretion channel CsgG
MTKFFLRGVAVVVVLLGTQVRGLHAQAVNSLGEKAALAVVKFDFAKGEYTPEYAMAVQSAVEEAFSKSNRFVLVERTRLDDLLKEIKTQEVLADTQVAKLGQIVGARYIVTGTVQDVTASSSGSIASPDTRLFTGHISVQIKMLEVQTARVLHTTQIRAQSAMAGQGVNAAGKGLMVVGAIFDILAAASDGKNKTQQNAGEAFDAAGKAAVIAAEATMPKSAGEAIQRALPKVTEQVLMFIKINLPIEAPFSQIRRQTKKGKVQEIEIFAGSDLGLKPREEGRVVVRSVRNLNGKSFSSTEPVGRVRVTYVSGPLTAVCRVVEGGRELGNLVKSDSSRVEIIFQGAH